MNIRSTIVIRSGCHERHSQISCLMEGYTQGRCVCWPLWHIPSFRERRQSFHSVLRPPVRVTKEHVVEFPVIPRWTHAGQGGVRVRGRYVRTGLSGRWRSSFRCAGRRPGGRVYGSPSSGSPCSAGSILRSGIHGVRDRVSPPPRKPTGRKRWQACQRG